MIEAAEAKRDTVASVTTEVESLSAPLLCRVRASVCMYVCVCVCVCQRYLFTGSVSSVRKECETLSAMKRSKSPPQTHTDVSKNTVQIDEC